jgi:hypothetical protein
MCILNIQKKVNDTSEKWRDCVGVGTSWRVKVRVKTEVKYESRIIKSVKIVLKSWGR